MTINSKQLLGVLLFTLLVSGTVYVQFDTNIKLRIDEDQTTFYMFNNETHRWSVAGRERHQMFDGTKLMYRDKGNIEVLSFIDNRTNKSIIIRTTPYIRGPVVKDIYLFDGNIKGVDTIPIERRVEIINATGYFYRYEAFDMDYDEPREKLYGTSFLFKNNMKIEWQDGYNWAWVYSNGKLKVQYKIEDSHTQLEMRMFDPLPTQLVKWNYIYENLSRQVPINKDTSVEVKPIYNEKNDTWSKAYNYTTSEIIGYETEYYQGDKIGIEVNNEKIIGNINIKDNVLSRWNIPIGDRNFEEYGRCREYEIEKGVCVETKI